MKLSRIGRQLHREVTAHPKRAAILGLLCLVALWFWAPLVWGWIDDDDPSAKAPVVASVTDPVLPPSAGVPAGANAAPSKPETSQYPWHQLVEWMDNDPRTSATNPGLGRRDPFLIVQAEAGEDGPEDERQVAQPEVTPEALGMVLSGTIVGPHRRVAQISGESYREGERVKWTKDGRQIEFTLAAVYSRRVVLKRNGEQFELTTPAPARPGRIELVGGGD